MKRSACISRSSSGGLERRARVGGAHELEAAAVGHGELGTERAAHLLELLGEAHLGLQRFQLDLLDARCMLLDLLLQRSTRSTPARLRPSSAVISWIRRSFSTSSWEYRRVPFGERCGSIRPRASYMRSVCGCILASSAATEIMKTPRSVSTSTRVRVVAVGGVAGARASPRLAVGLRRASAPPSRSSANSPRAGRRRASWRARRRPLAAPC